MSSPNETIASRLTSVGRSAVAVIQLQGPRAATILDAHFIGRSPSSAEEWPIETIRYGCWQAPGYQEDLVVTRLGPFHFEIHSHGGLAAPQAILGHLERAGCQIVDVAQAAERNLGPGTQATALLAASLASTPRIATILQWQVQGELQQSLEGLIQALLASSIDYAQLDRQLSELQDTYRYGRWTKTPASVVIAGPPNAGKSSLVNALLGFTRSLVFDRPGTTRDVVQSTTVIDGWPVTLSDTAGQRTETVDPLEQEGIERGRRAIETADVVVVLRPATELLKAHVPPPNTVAPAAHDLARCLPVWSKIDCVPHSLIPTHQLGTSTITGAGISNLIAKLGETLGNGFLDQPHPVLFSEHQFQKVSAARDALRSGQPAVAAAELSALSSLTQAPD